MTEATTRPVSKKRTGKSTQAKKPRVRRTYAQIAADNEAEQKRREELAAERAAKIPAPVSPKWSKTIHFVAEAGHTALGKVWYRGEEVTIEEDSPEFALAFDAKGNFIFRRTEDEQIDIYGEVRYREGPWPGLPYDTEHIYEPGQLSETGAKIVPTPAEIEALEKANRKRRLGY